MVDTAGLPVRYNPDDGFVASENNKPETESKVLVSCLFSPDHRVEQLKRILGSATKVDLVL
jgi:acyl-homoserine lactone acylase PvdQ